jgi:hypothetical protein
MEKVSTHKDIDKLKPLATELRGKLAEIELERKVDQKMVKLHPFEVASLANLVKAVSFESGCFNVY